MKRLKTEFECPEKVVEEPPYADWNIWMLEKGNDLWRSGHTATREREIASKFCTGNA